MRTHENGFDSCSELLQSKCRPSAFLLSLVLFPSLLIGCSTGIEDQRGERVAVDGIVTVDGVPLQAGRIIYVTNQGAGEVKATASIVQGFYAFTDQNGPLAGKARIEIYPQEMELEAFELAKSSNPKKGVNFTDVKIPARYNIRSTLEVDVQPDAESNLFRFDLKTE